MTTEDWKEVKQEWADFRLKRAEERINLLKAFCAKNWIHISELSPWQYRLIKDGIKIDYYPQRNRILIHSKNKWINLDKDWELHFKRLLNK